jgi:hypothetical protein
MKPKLEANKGSEISIAHDGLQFMKSLLGVGHRLLDEQMAAGSSRGKRHGNMETGRIANQRRDRALRQRIVEVGVCPNPVCLFEVPARSVVRKDAVQSASAIGDDLSISPQQSAEIPNMPLTDRTEPNH